MSTRAPPAKHTVATEVSRSVTNPRQKSGRRAYQAVPCALCKGGHMNRRRGWWSAGNRPRSSSVEGNKKIMGIQSGSLQTPATDSLGSPNVVLDGKVTGMDVLDPTENNEKT